MFLNFVCNLRAYNIIFYGFQCFYLKYISIYLFLYIKIRIGFEMLCYDAILAKTWIFKGRSQLSDIKSVHRSIIPLTAQALLSTSSYPAVNADL